MIHSLGLLPDLHDHRDFSLRDLAAARRLSSLPPAFSGRRFVSPVVDQGNLGSCTGQALAHGGREYLLNRDGLPFVPLSSLWLYQHELMREHVFGQDVGARLRDGLRELRNVGVPPESLWPYDLAQFDVPPPDLHLEAHPYKITGFYRLHMLLDIHAALVAGAAVVIGIRVFESFEGDQARQTGVIPLPMPGEKCLGGHALFVYGYEDAREREKTKNSWGTDYGAGGFCDLPYEYFNPARGLVMDMWAFTA